MRRTKQIAGPNQLDLFTSFSQFSRRYDNLLDKLILQAANLRYLITRAQYCSEVGPIKQSELLSCLEELLSDFRILCAELQKQSNKHSHAKFEKYWLYKEHVQITDASAFPSVDTLFEHLISCQKSFKSATLTDNPLLNASGKIVDNIKTKYQTLYLNNAFQSPRLKRYLYS